MSKTFSLAIYVAAFSLLIGMESAVASSIQGTYAGRGEGILNLKISGNNADMITTISGHCIGEIIGRVTPANNHIFYVKQSNANGSCEITLYFDDSFNNISVKEGECEGFHGMSCGFEGILKRTK